MNKLLLIFMFVSSAFANETKVIDPIEDQKQSILKRFETLGFDDPKISKKLEELILDVSKYSKDVEKKCKGRFDVVEIDPQGKRKKTRKYLTRKERKACKLEVLKFKIEVAKFNFDMRKRHLDDIYRADLDRLKKLRDTKINQLNKKTKRL